MKPHSAFSKKWNADYWNAHIPKITSAEYEAEAGWSPGTIDIMRQLSKELVKKLLADIKSNNTEEMK
jgi:hypothetical protein